MYLRKIKRHDNICSIYENIATDEVGNGLTIEETLYDSEYDILEDYLSNETKEEISHLLSFLTEKELMIIQLYYGIGGNYKTQKEIALLLGISQSYLSRMIKNIRAKLLIKYKSKTLTKHK